MSPTFIRLWLTVIIVIAIVIRVHGAGDHHLSPDESTITEIAEGKSLKEVLLFSRYETHPPGFYILLHYWRMISDDPAFLRGLSLLFGILTILLYYRIGRLLHGELAGMCAAALVTFSYGCIIQSYLVRQYAVFLFFLSCAFYYYQWWLRDRRNLTLLAYTAFAGIACFIHFSGILAVFCMAAAEMLWLFMQRASWRQQALWVTLNLALGIVSIATLSFWYPLLAELGAEWIPLHPSDTLSAPIYPVLALGYILPYRASAFYEICLFIIVAALFIRLSHIKTLRFHVATAIGALLLGSLLLAKGLYIANADRHSLWLLPFVIPLTACGLAQLCIDIKRRNFVSSYVSEPFLAAVILLSGILLYGPEVQFVANESTMTNRDWATFTHYMKGLDATSLIVTGRSDAHLLSYLPENLYPYYGESHYVGKVLEPYTVIIPYYHTHLILQLLYVNTVGTIIHTLQEAQSRGQLDTIQTLVFPSSFWSRGTTLDLMLCPTLDKKIIPFSAQPLPATPTQEQIMRIPALALIISKQAFFEQVASPNGKARPCFKDNYFPMKE